MSLSGNFLSGPLWLRENTWYTKKGGGHLRKEHACRGRGDDALMNNNHGYITEHLLINVIQLSTQHEVQKEALIIPNLPTGK